MTIAINLLISAMTLLTMIQQNPNLPQSFKDSAISIANQAIVVAQDEIAKANQTVANPIVINTVTPVQPVQQPVQVVPNNVIIAGAVNTQTNNKIMEIVIKNDSTGESISDTYTTNISNGSLVLKVDYKVDGVSKLETISMSTSDGQSRTMSKDERACSVSKIGGLKDDCSANFLFKLLTTGEKVATFTVGETVKTITIDVQ